MASLLEYCAFVYGVNCKNINLFGVLIMTVHFDPVTFIPYVRHPPNFFLSLYTHGGGGGGLLETSNSLKDNFKIGFYTCEH